MFYDFVWTFTPETPKTPDMTLFLPIGYPSALAISGTSNEMELVADSGCSQSIINNNKHLVNYSSTNITFRTADNGILTCIGKGDLCLTNQLTIKNVLYCPEIASNLISISQLCDQGFTVHTSKTVMTINRQKQAILRVYRQDDLYIYRLKPQAALSILKKNKSS
jgi:hypothetical protein